MAHDVFVSYENKDKPTADAVVIALEASRIPCWIAPRDVLPGIPFAEAIIEAIDQSSIMVLVLSSRSNESQHVESEVGQAASKRIPILPFRVENVPLSPSMQFWIGKQQWLDASTPPTERHLQQLAKTVNLLLSRRRPKPPEKPVSRLEEEMAAFREKKYDTNVAEEAKLREIVIKYPEDPKAHQYLGEFYNRCLRYEEAIAEFNRGIQLDAENALLHWDRALAYQQVGNRRAAASSLERAMSLGLDASRRRRAATLLKSLQSGRGE